MKNSKWVSTSDKSIFGKALLQHGTCNLTRVRSPKRPELKACGK